MDNEKNNSQNLSSHGDVTQSLFPGTGGSISFGSDGKKRCMGCMELYSDEFEICPHCGYIENTEVENALHIFPGTVLHDKYIIGKVIGYGGFGVTYLAWDTVLEIKIAIKEYLPSEFSTRSAGQTQITVFSGDKTKQFNDGMEKFVDEAKKLAKFRNENGIVKIFDSFSENGTAYIAMEYLQGETLAERLEREKTIPVEEAISLLMPIIESLNRVHDEGIIHRDIAPDNIFLTNKGEVKLIDFGASRYATTSRSRSLTVIIKPGYSAEEQYRSRGDQGPHTDVYSVGACLYRMVTGEIPPDAMERRAQFEKNHRDMLKPIRKFVKDIDQRRENAIYNAMNVRIEDRTPDMISLAGELTSEEPVKRRRSGIKKIDPLTWPLWAKIGIPAALCLVVTLSVLLIFGVIGPRSHLRNDYYVPENHVLVPNVVATEFEKAWEKLEKIDLKPKIADKRTSEVIPNGTVLTQDPDAFNVVLEGSVVELVYCDGHGMGFVPGVVGLDIEEAKALMEEKGFLVVVTEKESDIYSKGCVISQQFEEGTELEKQSEIELIVSKGNSDIDTSIEVDIPNLVGMDYLKAEQLLKERHLLVKQQYEYNASIPANQIVGQNPIAKTKAHQGDTVTVIVNQGEKTGLMPDVTMKEYSSAEAELQELGLDVYVVYKQNDKYKAGVVFEQSIPKGTKVTSGTKVTLTVSEGKTVTVPNVVGMKEAQAEKAIRDAGLAVSVSYEKSSTVAKGVVISQSEKAGKKLQDGQLVTITVSNGDKDVVSDIDGNEDILLSISVEKKPAKTSYTIGENIDTAGMKVVASFASGSKRDVTSECSVDPSKADTAGSMPVVVSYTDNDVTKTASFNITVKGPSITINPTSINIVVGGTASVAANTSPSGGSVNWSSSDSKVATVSGGTITGVKAGTATVKATFSYGGKTATATCSVNVSRTSVPPEGITISSSSLNITEGSTASLTATVTPANATSGNISWSTSDASVATVNNGLVVAGSPGTATITASTSNGKKATCSVTVTEIRVNSLEVIVNNSQQQEYSLGEKFEPRGVTVNALTDNGKKNVTNRASYKLDGDVNKTGKKTVNVSYGGKSATYSVTYIAGSIKLNTKSVTIKVGQSYTFTATTKSGNVTWTCSDTSVATVTPDGYKAYVAGKKAGTVTITASNGTNKDTATVKVEKEERTVSKTEVKPRSAVKYYVGDKISASKFSIEVTYNDGSKDTMTADVVSPAEITNEGSQTVTLSSGNYSANYTITGIVTPTIKLNKISLSLIMGESETIYAEVSPVDLASNVVWKSSKTTVATVSNKGLITAKGSGSAEITATLKNNDFTTTASCVVTVSKLELNLSTVNIKTYPSKLSYYVGDEIDLSGLEISANYNNGRPANITESSISAMPSKITSTSNKKIDLYYDGDKIGTYNLREIKTPQIILTCSGGSNEMYDRNGKITITAEYEPSYSSGSWTDCKWTVDKNDVDKTDITNTEITLHSKTVVPQEDNIIVRLSAKYKNQSVNDEIKIIYKKTTVKDYTVDNIDGVFTKEEIEEIFETEKFDSIKQRIQLNVVYNNNAEDTVSGNNNLVKIMAVEPGTGNTYTITIYYQSITRTFEVKYKS